MFILQSFTAPCFYFEMIECGAVQCGGAETSAAREFFNISLRTVLCF